MKLRTRISLLAILFSLHQFMFAAEAPTAKRGAVATTALARLPMSFEPAQASGRFVARSGSYTVSIGAHDSYIAINNGVSGPKSTLHFAFENANSAAGLEGIERLPGVINYYRGQDSRNWHLGVKTYAKLQAKSIYPGIDVVYYGDHRHLEFDFVVAAGTDPKLIALNVDGADRLSLSEDGNLVAGVNGKEFRFHKPYAYQLINGKQTPVAVEYALHGPDKASLRVGNYDKSRKLVIDPKLTYSTFMGGSQADTGNGIATDSSGNAYIAGKSCSTDFIGGANFKGTTNSCDAYVSKLDPTGQTVLWTTFIAGQTPVPNPATASANGVAVDASGNVYVIGTTNFFDLPLLTTPGPTDHKSTYNGGDSDAFISILNTSGALLRETYLGGSKIDQGFGITVDQQQNVTGVGQTCSSDFPAYNSIEAKVEACVGFITKLDFGLHIAGPTLPGASPVSPRHSSLTDTNCSTGALCPATPDATQTYYFFSTLFGGQPLPPEASWPSLSAPSYQPGVPVPLGAITIGTPNCGLSDTKPPQVLLAEGTGTAGGLTWPCGSIKPKAGIPDGGGFAWLDLGDAPPSVLFSTTSAYGVALDPVGDVFAVGGTSTPDLTPFMFYAGYEGIHFGKTGAWVLKLSGLDGHQIYATALTTSPDTDAAPNSARAIAVDTSGQAFITGVSSGSLMTTPGAANSGAIGGKDAFVVKLDIPASHFLYATYLGGTGDDQGLAIAIDNGGAAYVAGSTTSADLKLINPLQDSAGNAETSLLGPQDAFIARVSPSGSATTMMAYLGGASSDQANGIALDQTGNIYIGGTTQSVDFPIVPAAAAAPGKTIYGGGTSDAFVTLINGATFPIASVSPATLNFGTQNVGTTSASQTVTLRNTGSGILNISSISFAGPGGGADYSQTNNCGGQLTPQGGAKDNCTITVTFAPTAGGSRPDIIQIVDDSANSPQTVALSGSGVSVQGTIQLSPSTLAFGSQPIGTTSAAKTVTLTNSSSTFTLTISSIAISNAAFKQTNNCPVSPATLAANASCTLQVTFAPTAAASATASLTVTGVAANSPQSIALTGTGTSAGASGAPDFTLTSSQQSITAPSTGGTATFQISAAPLNGFNQALSLTCTAPSGATCSASPSSVQMDGTSIPSSSITVTVSGSHGSGGINPRTELRHGPRAIYASILPFCTLGLVVVGRKRRAMFVLLLVLCGTVLFSVNCGSNTSTGGMAPGTYQVTVTGAASGANAMSHSTTITLTVS